MCCHVLQVTEEQLATFFQQCGRVVDCRICGDPNSAMRFAFLEFANVESAQRVRVSSTSGRAGRLQLSVGLHVLLGVPMHAPDWGKACTVICTAWHLPSLTWQGAPVVDRPSTRAGPSWAGRHCACCPAKLR